MIQRQLCCPLPLRSPPAYQPLPPIHEDSRSWLTVSHYRHIHRNNLHCILTLQSFCILADICLPSTSPAHSRDHTLHHHRGHYHPFQRLQHFLDALRRSNPLTLPLLKWNPSHHPHFPPYAAWIPDLSFCSLASMLPYLAHLTTCHPCLAKSQLCLNSIPCLLSSQTQAIV